MPAHQARQPSRRDFLIQGGAVGASIGLGLLPPLPASRAGEWKVEGPVEEIRRAALTAAITMETVRDRLYCIAGLGGNIAVLDDGGTVALVDGGLVGDRLARTVASLTPSPIHHLINTHWHFDHTDANGWLGKHGATIVAHANTRRHLAQPTRVEDFGYTFEPAPPSGLPSELIRAERVLEAGRAKVVLRPYGPAHTDGDIAIRFDAANVLHTGDTWWNGSYPFIDYSTGGSLDGMIAATEANLAMTTSDTRIVPGHGAIGDRRQLREFHELLTSARDRVGRLKRLGHSVDEVIRRRPHATWDGRWGNALVTPEFFTRLIYRGIP
jgi:glyoxylase-like metal-dependent hydrolase (beta-lactamase superfamily II)